MEIDLEAAFAKTVYISPNDFLAMWLTREPTDETRQDCVVSQHGAVGAPLLREIMDCAKHALAAYAMPMHFPLISVSMHHTNAQFMQDFERVNTDPEFLVMLSTRMNDILDQKVATVELPSTASMVGYYIRTPIRIWDTDLRRMYSVPQWEQRDSLNDCLIIGNNNCYVMKTVEGEVRVMFRGTSNEFNGMPQYGRNLENTQIFRLPDFCVEERAFYPEGSESVPLFYFYYWCMIEDLKPFIYAAIDLLAPTTRIVVTGHSMGGGLSITFAYVMKLDRPDLFHMADFRQFASPLCCNDAAAARLMSWFARPQQFVDVVNHDDFVNMQYMFGGQKSFQQSLESGTSSVLAWLVKSGLNEQHRSHSTDWLKRALSAIRLNTDVVMALFLNQASARQPRHAAHRAHPTRLATSHVVFCKRRFVPSEEYLGRAHDEYMNLSMALFWTPLRIYENALYSFYAEHGLRTRNSLILLPMHIEGHELPQLEARQWQPDKRLLAAYCALKK